MRIYAPLSMTTGSVVSHPRLDALKAGYCRDANNWFWFPDDCIDASPNVPAGSCRVESEWTHDGMPIVMLSGHKLRAGVL
jgi:hypothetical protein